MTDPRPARRALLLGASALALAGCETLDNLLGERKTPLPGERRPVLRAGEALSADPAAAGRPLALPPPEARAEWPQEAGGPERAPGHVAAGETLGEVWRAGIGAGSARRQRLVSGPVSAGGLVFASDAAGVVSALDLASGARRWSRDTGPERGGFDSIGAGLAHDQGTLYAATASSEVLALDPASGAVRWRAPLTAPARGGIAASGGRLLVPTVENHLLAVSAEDGRRLWTHRGQPVSAVPLGLSAPAVEGSTVVAGFPSGEVAALRLEDGRVLWTEGVSGGPGARRGGIAELSGVSAPPMIRNGRVLVAGLSLLVAVDLRSGRRLWEREIGSPHTPAAAGDWLFLVTTEGEAAAVGRHDGRVRWVRDLDARPAGDRRGAPLVAAAPLLASGRLLVPTSAGEVVVLDPAEGEVSRRVRLPAAVLLPPAAAGGAVLLLAEDARVIALR